MLRGLLLWGSENAFLAERMARLAFVHRAVRRFMPGETSEDAIEEAEKLSASRITSMLTLLGEKVTDAEEAAEVTQHYQGVLEAVAERELNAEISVKPTQLGIDIGSELAAANLETILATAEARGQFVWIDMESSEYVDRTLHLYLTARARYVNTGVCLQAYLYRTAEDLAGLLPAKPSIRLVKGAYAEGPEAAYPKKKDVDENYLKLARTLLEEVRESGVRVAFATHDERLFQTIEDEAAERGIDRGDLEIQMLYGIGTARQMALAAKGYKVVVLISYGTAWFPWYMRRLAERPANLWFVIRKVVSR
ncbi:MAG TPA: proline dehydrogenase [Gemmatimonadetes bacterium]|nr:proline dehydrogenase [Gemmatimonadota bacterium]